jgi:hypothetical protein
VSGSSVSGALVLGDGSAVPAAVVVLVVLALVLVVVVDGAAVDVVDIEVVGELVVVVVIVVVVGTTVEVDGWVTGATSVCAGDAPSVRATVHPEPITRIAVRLATDRRTDTAAHATGHVS